MKRKFFLCIAAACIILLASCEKKAEEPAAGAAAVQLQNEESEIAISGGGITAILFAYNYNSPEFVRDCIKYLDGEFGLEENGGIIKPLVFPDDFKSGNKPRISLLRNYVRDTKINALIALGAPEDTAAALTVLRDQGWKTPVYSLFPQDEPLPSEYVSAFVLENADLQRPVDAESLFLLLSKLVRYAQTADELNNATIKNVLQNVVGFNWQILPYIDSETGIRPANHFVLQSDLPVRYGTIK
ncbi:MAG: hypothetical protein J6V73_00775 [Spirochaetaceae bacterium]|nr:hypothetical protein [Spirochaetaceae bacterium]